MCLLARARNLRSMASDSITARDPADPLRPTGWALLVAVTAAPLTAVLILALALLPAVLHLERRVPEPENEEVDLLVIGDSSSGRESCPWCLTYVDQFAAALAKDGGTPVRVEDHSWRPNAQPPARIASALFFARTDPALRTAIYSADVIVLAIGGADVGTVPVSRACRSDRRALCSEDLATRFAEHMTTWIAEAKHIRRDRPVVLRVITPLTGTDSPTGRDLAVAACRVAVRHQGGCVDLSGVAHDSPALSAGRPVAGHLRLNQTGHDVVAEQLMALGSD